jgi:hypothetical protein
MVVADLYAAGYGSSTPASGSSSSYPAHTSAPSSSYSAPPSQYTAAPSDYQSQTVGMPYSSYMNGGYKSMNCGYGYSKESDGSCQTQSWYTDNNYGCMETIIINQ